MIFHYSGVCCLSSYIKQLDGAFLAITRHCHFLYWLTGWPRWVGQSIYQVYNLWKVCVIVACCVCSRLLYHSWYTQSFAVVINLLHYLIASYQQLYING